MFGFYKGQRVAYAELREYALNETPFINPKSMLKHLENTSLLQSVEVLPGRKRRRGTFSEDAVVAVVFAGGGAGA